MITFKTHFDIDPNLFAQNQADVILTQQVMKDTRPFVPALTNSLNNRTHIEHGNQIVYPAPYARYLYYGKVMVDSETGRGAVYIKDVGFRFRRGATLVPTDRDLVFTTEVHPQAQSHWFEASKAQNLEKWKRVLAKAVTHYGK
ncbi:MAG: hypothetical protein KBS60_03175 [Phascolarctobacterium sp.]|nr:hypothetical protein [Candidatus Phascolarctobacterium caballi]